MPWHSADCAEYLARLHGHQSRVQPAVILLGGKVNSDAKTDRGEPRVGRGRFRYWTNQNSPPTYTHVWVHQCSSLHCLRCTRTQAWQPRSPGIVHTWKRVCKRNTVPNTAQSWIHEPLFSETNALLPVLCKRETNSLTIEPSAVVWLQHTGWQLLLSWH